MIGRTGIGIDIGCRQIKIVRVKTAKRGIRLVDYGSIDTPQGAVESGNIDDVHRAGEAVAELVQEMRLENRQAVAAVSGPQVYIRTLTMPKMKLGDLRTAARYEASVFLPIPVAEVVFDIFPLREYRDAQGWKVDLFFTAVRRSQVSKVSEVCHRGGLRLQAIDLEPLAIQRVVQKPADADTYGFLHIGASRTTFSVFDDGALVFHRHLPMEGYGHRKIFDSPANAGLLSGSQEWNEPLIHDITAQLIRSMEYFALQNKKEVTEIIITGGKAHLPELEQFVYAATGCKAERGDPLSRMELPEWADVMKTRELRYDYTVALGLAARGKR